MTCTTTLTVTQKRGRALAARLEADVLDRLARVPSSTAAITRFVFAASQILRSRPPRDAVTLNVASHELPDPAKRADIIAALTHDTARLGHPIRELLAGQATLGDELRTRAAELVRRSSAAADELERSLWRDAAIRHHRRVLETLDGLPVQPEKFDDVLSAVCAGSGVAVVGDTYRLCDAAGQAAGDPISADDLGPYFGREDMRQAASEAADEVDELRLLVLAMLVLGGHSDTGGVDALLDAGAMPDLGTAPLDADILDPDGLIRSTFRLKLAEKTRLADAARQQQSWRDPLAEFDAGQTHLFARIARDKMLREEQEQAHRAASILDLTTPMLKEPGLEFEVEI